MTIQQKKRKPLSPAERRRRNLAEFWEKRYAEAADDPGKAIVIAFDRARAAAARADKWLDGEPVTRQLFEHLKAWAEQIERQLNQQPGHGS